MPLLEPEQRGANSAPFFCQIPKQTDGCMSLKSRLGGVQVTVDPQRIRHRLPPGPSSETPDRQRHHRQDSRVGSWDGTAIPRRPAWLRGSTRSPLRLVMKHNHLNGSHNSLGHTLSDICLEGLIPHSWGWRTLSGRGEMGNTLGMVSRKAKWSM